MAAHFLCCWPGLISFTDLSLRAGRFDHRLRQLAALPAAIGPSAGGRTTLSASRLALIIVLLVIVNVPLALILTYGVNEIRSWVTWLVQANREGIPVPERIVSLSRSSVNRWKSIGALIWPNPTRSARW